MYLATPAFCELLLAILSILPSISYPISFISLFLIDLSAPSLTCSNTSGPIVGQVSATKFLNNPGAIFCIIIAASIKIVPEPQNGSTKV